ncbi:MAG: DUF6279 family lipoprotein [Gammaproteobacteria bacterium]|nr:DUF6279 family lipoprotein [Gammaproteobacteria bacterium]
MTVSSTRTGRRAAAALLLPILLSGCSIAKLMYAQSDWLLLRKLDAYLNLTPEQKTAASLRLKSRLESHRKEELPGYLSYLRRTRALVEDGVDSAEAEFIIRRGRALTTVSVERTLPAIAQTLSGISPAQIQHLEQHFEKKNRRFRKNYLQASERERFLRSVQRTTRRIEHWTGTLSENQKQRLTELRAAFPRSGDAWLDYNKAKQRRLLALLREDADAETLLQFLNGWWIKLEGRTPSLRQSNDESFDALKNLVVGVDASLDNAQRRFLLRRLDSYIRQIEELIALS